MLDELSQNSIWIDAEYVELFANESQETSKLGDEIVVEIPVSLYRDKTDLLIDVGRFYTICHILFADGSVHSGLAYIRAHDFMPYALNVFYSRQRVLLPLNEIIKTQRHRFELEKVFQISVDDVYPVRIHVCVDGLPEIMKVCPSPFERGL